MLGEVLEFVVDSHDTAIRAKVTWRELASFRHSRTRSRTEWLAIESLRPVPGQDYTAVPRTPAERQPPSHPDEQVPPHWPPGVPGPDTPGWQKHACAFLYEQIPADYRAHAVLAEHPIVLAQMAITHLRHAHQALKQDYRSAPYQLKQHLEPHALAELDDTYRQLLDQVARSGRAAVALEKALRAVGRSSTCE